MVTALIFIAILVFLIVTHEFGHFLAAKIFGVRVDEFGVGYPPRAFTFGRWGDTEYTLNWIPFGGFVRLFGEEADAKGKGSFAAAARWKQALILIAGVTVNALTAWLLFAGALHSGIPRVVDSTMPLDSSARLVVSNVVPGSPAAAAGISAGDTITNLTDDAGATLSKVTPEEVSTFVRARGGKRISITYLHGASSTSASVIPANAVLPGSAATPALGVGLVEVSNVSLPWGAALREGLSNTRDAFVTVASSLWQLAKSAVHGNARLQDVVGPVGLVSVVGEAARNGLGNVLALAGFIAVNLAIINLIPIPAFDGGRLVVVLFEVIARRSAPRVAINMINTIGIALTIILMLVVTYHDIARLLT